MSSSVGNVHFSQREKIVLPIGASLSLISVFVVLWLFYGARLPSLRRHPNRLAVNKCIFEFVFCLQFLFVPFMDPSNFYSGDNGDKATTLAGLLSFISQFTLLGAAITNPFTSYKLNARYFRSAVYIVSIFCASGLIVSGPDTYGLTNFGVCWIRERSSSKINWAKWVFFYIWMLIIYIYCLVVVMIVMRRLKGGLPATLEMRESVLKRGRSYVIGYTLFWIIPGIFYLIQFLASSLSDVNGPRHWPLFISFPLSMRGFVSMVILLVINWNDLRASEMKMITNLVDEDMALRPHLNMALRKEILYYTTEGIRQAVLHQCRQSISFTFETSDVLWEDEKSDSTVNARFNMCRISSLKNTNDYLRNSSDSSNMNNNSNNNNSNNSSNNISRFENPIRSTKIIDKLSNNNNIDDINKVDIENFNDHNTSVDSTELYEISRQSDVRMEIANELKLPLNIVDIETNNIIRQSNESFRFSLDEAAQKANENRQNEQKTINSIELPNNKTSEKNKLLQTDKTNWKIQPTDNIDSLYKIGNSDLLKSNKFVSNRSLLSTLTTNSNKTKSLKTGKNGQTEEFEVSFRDYSSSLFAKLRELTDVDPIAYTESLRKTTKERFSEGRSGAFLYFSSDEKYIVKTTSYQEIRSLLRILPAYVEHLIANPKSLLVRFLGAHAVTMYGQTIYFVVMINVFHKAQLHERYDLKGSYVDRHADMPTQGKRVVCRYCNDNYTVGSKSLCPHRPNMVHAPNVCFKDNDLNYKMIFRSSTSHALEEQILRDTAFLNSQQLMDYSLLVGVHRRRFEITLRQSDELFNQPQLSLSSNQSNGANIQSMDESNYKETDPLAGLNEEEGLHAAVVEGPGTYFLGIIDVLQEWDYSKKMEHFFKVYIRLLDKKGISAVAPDYYRERFMTRCVKEVLEGCSSNDCDGDKGLTPREFVNQGLQAKHNSKPRADRRFSATPLPIKLTPTGSFNNPNPSPRSHATNDITSNNNHS